MFLCSFVHTCSVLVPVLFGVGSCFTTIKYHHGLLHLLYIVFDLVHARRRVYVCACSRDVCICGRAVSLIYKRGVHGLLQTVILCYLTGCSGCDLRVASTNEYPALGPRSLSRLGG